MGFETASFSKVQKAAAEGNPEALCESGIRKLTGLLGAEADVAGAYADLSEAASNGYEPAEKILDGVDSSPEDEEGAAEIMCNLAEMHARRTVDLEGLPGRKEDYDRAWNAAKYWFVTAANAGSVRAIYGLGNMYYMVGGKYYEAAAVMFTYASGIEGEYADKALQRLYTMLTNNWMRNTWNCYPDAVYVLDEYGEEDVSEYKAMLDENTPLDDLTAEKILDPETVEYPFRAEESPVTAMLHKKRTLQQAIIKLGIPNARKTRDGYRFLKTGNERYATDLVDMGYNVRETSEYYYVRERKQL